MLGRICSNCGKVNVVDSQFCVKCGQNIADVEPREVADIALEQPRPAARTFVRNNGVITDIQIPFGRLVVLILQFYLASIPAVIILSTIAALAFGCLSAIGLISIGNLFK